MPFTSAAQKGAAALAAFAVLGAGGTAIAGWTDFRERAAGETIELTTATAAKRWSLRSAAGDTLRPKRLLLIDRVLVEPDSAIFSRTTQQQNPALEILLQDCL